MTVTWQGVLVIYLMAAQDFILLPTKMDPQPTLKVRGTEVTVDGTILFLLHRLVVLTQ